MLYENEKKSTEDIINEYSKVIDIVQYNINLGGKNLSKWEQYYEKLMLRSCF